MRTYLLALTKYGLTAAIVIYTIAAFVILFQKRKSRIFTMTAVEFICILAYQLIAYVTLAVAMSDLRYLFLFLVEAVMFFAATILFQSLYRNAHAALFNNMCMLLSIGLVIQSRLSFSNATHQFIIALGGLAFIVFMPLLRSKFYLLKLPKYGYALAGIAILAVVMLLGSMTLGANITYTVFGITFQPSEFVKILYLLFLAAALKDVEDFKDFLIVGIFAAAHVLVLIGSTDLGSGLIFYTIFLFMAYLATSQWIILALGFGAAAIGSVVLYFAFDHIRVRVEAFLNPWNFMDSIGYQITQSLFAIGAGGPFGSGLGQGTPEKIPFVESDCVFAGVCEEMGLIIGVCVVLLCLNCFLHMMKLSMGFADKFYRLLAYGIAIEFGFQTFLTLGGQTKFIPLTGVTLPFISYGGSSILSMSVMFTLVEIMYILRGDRIDEIRRQHQEYARRSRERIGRNTERSGRADYDDYVTRGYTSGRTGGYAYRSSGRYSSYTGSGTVYGSSYSGQTSDYRDDGYYDDDPEQDDSGYSYSGYRED